MIKVNRSSKIKIYWKIWRGVNKASEMFDAKSNLRVFLVGSSNTYNISPVINKDVDPGYDVVEIEVPQLTLVYGAYDLKALWQKNDGRNLHMSMRSGVFGVADDYEVPVEDKTLRIVSYVESYGRDGLSAYESAVMRGLNRGMLSEVEWLEGKFAAEGGAGVSAVFDADIPIGGTTLGDELLAIDDANEFVSKEYLDKENKIIRKGTPFQALFKALLSSTEEIKQPEWSVKDGSYEPNNGTIKINGLPSTSAKVGDTVEFTVAYTPKSATITSPGIEGMTYGYAKDAELSEKSTDDVIYSDYVSTAPSQDALPVVKANGEVLTPNLSGKYSFKAVEGDNVITVNITEPYHEGYFPVVTVWPLDEKGRLAKDCPQEGVSTARLEVRTESNTLTESRTVVAVVPSYVNYRSTTAGERAYAEVSYKGLVPTTDSIFTMKTLGPANMNGFEINLLLPVGLAVSDVETYIWNPSAEPPIYENETNNITWVSNGSEEYDGKTYNKYTCSDSVAAKGTYFIKIK